MAAPYILGWGSKAEGTGAVSVPIWPAVNGTGGGGGAIGGTDNVSERYATEIKVPVATTLDSISIWLYKTGNPTDNIHVEIQTDNAGAPSETTVGTGDTIASANLTADAFNAFAVSASLSANTTYWAVISRTGAFDASNYWAVRRVASSNNIRGSLYGTSWTTTTSPCTYHILKPGDIIVMFVEESGTAYGSITDSAGGTWTLYPDGQQTIGATTTIAQIQVFWSRWDGDQNAPTYTPPSNHGEAVTCVIRGVTTDDPHYDVTSGGTEGQDSSVSITGDTSTVADTLVLGSIALNDDAYTFGASWGDDSGHLASFGLQQDISTTAGNDGRLGVVSGTLSSATTYGAFTNTLSGGTATKAFHTVALKPGTGAQNVNAALISNAGQIFAPTLTKGNINVSASLITQAPSIFDVTLTKTLNVSVTLISQAPTVFAPSLTLGGINVSAGLISNAGQIFALASIDQAGGAQNVDVTLISQAPTVFEPTLTKALSVSFELIQQLGAEFAPSISYGNLNVSASLISQTGQIFAPSLTLGNINVSLPLISQVGSPFDIGGGTSDSSTTYSGTADGYVYYDGYNFQYTVDTSGTTIEARYESDSNPADYITQGFIYFDTSAIPDDAEITSATLALYITADNTVQATTIEAYPATWRPTVTSEDFDFTLSGRVAYKSTVGLSTNVYTALDDDGLAAAINKGGETQLLIALTNPGSYDANNIAFTSGDGTNKPRLVVEYTVGGGGIQYGNLNVSVALISQVGTALAPSIEQEGGAQNVNAALISNVGQIFAVSVSQDLGIGFISNTGQIFNPTLSKALNVSVTLIQQTPQVFNPSLTYGAINVNVSLISQTPQIFAVTWANSSINAALIQQTPQIFSLGSISYGDLNLSVALVQNLGQVFNLTIDQTGSPPQDVTTALIVNNPTTFTATLTLTLDQPIALIQNSPVVFEPDYSKVLTTPLGVIQQTAVIFDITETHILDLPLPLIQNLGGMLPLGMTFDQEVLLELLQRIGTPLATEEVGIPTIPPEQLWREYVEDWLSNPEHLCKNRNHEHWKRSAGQPYFVP
jgi:hypothetical protein